MTLLDDIADLIISLADAFQTALTSALEEAVLDIGNAITVAVETAINAAIAPLEAAVLLAIATIELAFEEITALIGTIIEGIEVIFAEIQTFIVDTLNLLVNTVETFIDETRALLSTFTQLAFLLVGILALFLLFFLILKGFAVSSRVDSMRDMELERERLAEDRLQGSMIQRQAIPA